MYSYKDIFKDKKKVLFVTAHPDDVDVFFGGTLARLMEDRKKAYVVVVTNGARGSRENDISETELGSIREKEQINALKQLGLSEKNFETFGYLDGTVENDMELIGKISFIIRKFQPDMVCTHEPHGYYFTREKDGQTRQHVNHRDHRNVGISTVDAVYPFSRDRSFFKEQFSNGGKPHTVKEMLFTFDNTFNAKIDISNQVEKKIKALNSHKTQFDNETIERIMDMFEEEDKYFERGNHIKLAW